MRKFKIVSWGLICIMSASVLAGCSGGDKGDLKEVAVDNSQ